MTQVFPGSLRAGAWAVARRSLGAAVDLERLFPRLFTIPGRRVWLDSSGPGAGSGHFSIAGEASDAAGARFTYRVGDPGVRVERFASGGAEIAAGDVFEVLRGELARIATAAEDLPFTGGLVGWFGYELKEELGFTPLPMQGQGLLNDSRTAPPDAAWLLIDRFVVVDHRSGTVEALALVPPRDEVDGGPGRAQEPAQAWLEHAARLCAEVDRSPASSTGVVVPSAPAGCARAEAAMRRTRQEYLAGVASAQAALQAGESYEVCVTDTARVSAAVDAFEVYRTLRQANPAPYAAFLDIADVQVLSASPERFLHIDARGRVETRPIKGTAARHPDPHQDEAAARALRTDAKTRAENLIVVDLLRNDLHRVCAPGSVVTQRLLEVETYPSVHQLVSTVVGDLRPGLDALDAVRACFPGGSMTGAPKRRTCEIIDAIEGAPRGIYSGAMGYLSACGAADLAIVIRTAVIHDGEIGVGAGGGIVLDSDPEAEHAEMLLKAAATLRVIDAVAAAAASRATPATPPHAAPARTGEASPPTPSPAAGRAGR